MLLYQLVPHVLICSIIFMLLRYKKVAWPLALPGVLLLASNPYIIAWLPWVSVQQIFLLSWWLLLFHKFSYLLVFFFYPVWPTFSGYELIVILPMLVSLLVTCNRYLTQEQPRATWKNINNYWWIVSGYWMVSASYLYVRELVCFLLGISNPGVTMVDKLMFITQYVKDIRPDFTTDIQGFLYGVWSGYEPETYIKWCVLIYVLITALQRLSFATWRRGIMVSLWLVVGLQAGWSINYAYTHKITQQIALTQGLRSCVEGQLPLQPSLCFYGLPATVTDVIAAMPAMPYIYSQKGHHRIGPVVQLVARQKDFIKPERDAVFDPAGIGNPLFITWDSVTEKFVVKN